MLKKKNEFINFFKNANLQDQGTQHNTVITMQ